MSNKKLLSLLLVALLFAVSSFVVPKYFSSEIKQATGEEQAKKTISVKTQPLSEFKSVKETIEYPAIVKNDQDVKIVAKTSGTASKVNFELGDKVFIGELLVKIEDVGTGSATSLGIKNNQLAQGEVALEQAQESLDLTEKSYRNLKDSSEKDLKLLKIALDQAKKTGDKTQIDIARNQLKGAEIKNKTALSAAKTQKELADLQYKNASLNFNTLKDSHLITSPFSGTITQKSIAEGETVSAGQVIGNISKVENTKIQFFVDQNEVGKIQEGMPIQIKSNDEKVYEGRIENISPTAESTTKRFLVEAKLSNESLLSAETVVDVSFEIEKTAGATGQYILPLSAITVGQNESYIFVSENNKAKKIPVEIVKIEGEKAEVKIDLPGESLVIIEGNKLVSEGEEVNF